MTTKSCFALRRYEGIYKLGGLWAFALNLFLAATSAMVSAFTTINRPNNIHHAARQGKRTPISSTNNAPWHLLQMSSIGHDDESSINKNQSDEQKFSWKDALPPPPEDQLVMTGDVGSIFVYTFLDHSLNDMYVDMLNAQDSAATAASFDPSLVGDAAAAVQLPVWYDAAHSAFGPLITTKVLPVLHAAYAPAISTAGGAACLLTAAWLVAGYFTGAFLFRNTLECGTTRTLWVAGKTWLLAAAMVAGAALASDAFVGWCDCVRTPSLGGLTQADGEFIFSSLSVLVFWRYILNWMLGSGER